MSGLTLTKFVGSVLKKFGGSLSKIHGAQLGENLGFPSEKVRGVRLSKNSRGSALKKFPGSLSKRSAITSQQAVRCLSKSSVGSGLTKFWRFTLKKLGDHAAKVGGFTLKKLVAFASEKVPALQPQKVRPVRF
jgi:hypothetical protein